MACLFEILSVVFCIHYLYGEKIKIDIMTAFIVTLEILLMNAIYLLNLKQMLTMMMYPIMVIYCGLKFGFNLKTIFVNNIIYMAILSGIQTTLMVLFSVMLKLKTMEPLENLLINAIMFCIVVIVLRKCRLEYLSKVLQSNEKVIMISLTVFIVSTVLFVINYKQNRSFEMFYYIVLGVSIILIIVAAIDIGKHKIKAKEMEAELRLHKMYESSFRNMIDEIRARQHEFDNHINAILNLHRVYDTYEGLVKEQEKYGNGIKEENRYNKILSKGNPVILCFLYSRFLEMDKKGIAFTYEISIGNLECGMPVHKLVEILGNLTKNAMEAVEKKGKGEIHVKVVEEDNIIEIEVANESEKLEKKKREEMFKKGYSEKGENRGYGLYNVGRICEEYGGAVGCNNEEREGKNWLVFRIVIRKNEKAEIRHKGSTA